MSIPNKDGHSHGRRIVWTDDEIIEHVKTQHEGLDEQPWLTNESNIQQLVTMHQNEHGGDPFSFR